VSDQATPSSSSHPVVFRFGAFGDLVMLTPMLHLLHRRYGRPCILVTSGGWSRPLFEGHPDVCQVITLKSRSSPYLLDRTQWQLVQALGALAENPIYVCDSRRMAKFKWLLRRAGIDPSRCAFQAECEDPRFEHRVDHWLAFAKVTPPAYRSEEHVWANVDLKHAPSLHVTQHDRDDLRAWREARGLDGPLVLLQTGNKRTFKRGRFGLVGDDRAWPCATWVQTCQSLLAADQRVQLVLCGVPNEAALLEAIRARVGSPRVHVAATDLPMRRLLALLEVAHSMISVDTGPAHAAAALGCPLVVLYGAESSGVWRPRSPTGSDVLTLGGPPHSTSVAEIQPEAVLDCWTRLAKRMPLETTLPTDVLAVALAGAIHDIDDQGARH